MNTTVNRFAGEEKSERLTWIDSLKGFTILTVVLGHIASEYFNIGEFENFKSIELFIRNGIYSFHMPLFIMISGFVFSLAYVKNDGVIKKDKICVQIGNISIAYVLWNSLSCIARMLFSKNVYNGASIKNLLMFPLKAVDPFWYLYVLILCYFVTMLLSKKLMSRGFAAYAIYTVSLVLCFSQIFINRILWGFTVSKFLLYYFFFILGFLINKNKKVFKIISNPICIAIHFLIGIVLWFIFVFGSDEVLPWNKIKFFGVIMAYALSIAIFGFAKAFSNIKKIKRINFLSTIGRYSFEIYTIHCFLTTATRMILHKLSFIGFVESVCINFVIAVFVPIIISVVLKKIKLHGLFFAPVTWVKRMIKGKA